MPSLNDRLKISTRDRDRNVTTRTISCRIERQTNRGDDEFADIYAKDNSIQVIIHNRGANTGLLQDPDKFDLEFPRTMPGQSFKAVSALVEEGRRYIKLIVVGG